MRGALQAEGLRVSDLIVKIGGDARAFRSTMRGLKGEAAQAGRAIGAGLLGPLAGAGMTAGIIAMGKSALQAADDIGKGAKRLGVSTDEYQRLNEMAKRTGATVENVEAAFKRMATSVTGTDEEARTAQRTMANLGLTLDEVRGLKPDELFRRLSAAIAAIPDPVERAARAQEVFGRSGTQLMPLIGEYEKVRGEVEATQKLMDGDAIAAAERWNDSIAQLGSNIQTSLINSGLLDWLGDVAEGMDDLAEATNRLNKGEVKAESTFDAARRFAAGVLGSTVGVAATGGAGAALSLALGIGLSGSAGIEARSVDLPSGGNAKWARNASQWARDLAARRRAEAGVAATEQARLEKTGAATAKTLDNMRDQVHLQELRNAGLEREAAILEAINAAMQANADITDADLKAIEELAGRLFDLRAKKVEAAAGAKGAPAVSDPYRPEITALERIGAIIGGPQRNDPGLAVQRDIRRLSERQVRTLEQIRDNSGCALGNV